MQYRDPTLLLASQLPRRGATAGGGEKRANVAPLHAGIVWIRSDLRVSDHEALAAAATECSNLVPLYCFDPCEYGKVCDMLQ
jgi:hypothetical protein